MYECCCVINTLYTICALFVLMLAERTEFQLPLLLRSGNRYKVIVRGLKQQRQNLSTTAAECFSVLCRGSAEVRAGEGETNSGPSSILLIQPNSVPWRNFF